VPADATSPQLEACILISECDGTDSSSSSSSPFIEVLFSWNTFLLSIAAREVPDTWGGGAWFIILGYNPRDFSENICVV